MEIFTIGFTQTPAREFFGKLKEAKVQRLVDVRLNNTSQLAAYAKRDDLAYFLSAICNIQYHHEPLLAPTQDILDQFKKMKGQWSIYREKFLQLMSDRQIESQLDRQSYVDLSSALLCSEHTAEHCHRSLVVEYLQGHWTDLKVVHL